MHFLQGNEMFENNPPWKNSPEVEWTNLKDKIDYCRHYAYCWKNVLEKVNDNDLQGAAEEIEFVYNTRVLL